MWNKLEEVKESSVVHKQLLKIIPKKDVCDTEILFLENDYALYSSGAAANFRRWLTFNKIPSSVLGNIGELPMEYLVKMCTYASFLIFQTTGTYEIVRELPKQLLKYTEEGYRFNIIECYISEPNFYHIPKGGDKKNINFWSLNSFREDMDDWDIKKLK